LTYFLKCVLTWLVGLSLFGLMPSITMAQNNTRFNSPTKKNQSIENLQKQLKTLQEENQTLQNNLTELQQQDQQLQIAQKDVLTANQTLSNTNNQLTQQITQLQQQLLISNQTASTFKNALIALQQAKPPQLTFSQFIQRFSNDNWNHTEILQPSRQIDLLTQKGIPFLAVILILFIALPMIDIFQQNRKRPLALSQPETPSLTDVNVQRYTSFAGEDVVASKLDLAHAYINMGNKASAQTLIKEVFEEGNEQQRADASKLLTQIES